METTPVLFEPLFTAREVAASLDVCHQTIARWVHGGRIVPAKKAGLAYVFTAAEVERVRAMPWRGKAKVA